MELILRILRRAMWYACRLLPIQKNKIVFVSYYGRGYSDNPKYVAEALLETGVKMKYIWIANDEKNAEVPNGFVTAPLNSFRYIYHMSTAKFWVDNARKYWCTKKKNQKYVQCWHGGFGLKKIEKDAFDKLEPDYQRMALLDASMTDLMVSNSKTLTKLYRDAFWYEEGEILECGLPRNDRLFSYTDEDVKLIKERLSIPKDKKIALYAPTFRQSKTLSVYDMDYNLVAEKLGERFGGEWIVLVRLHPNVFKLSNNIEFDNKVTFNASMYNDIQELYMISDLCMTDYSSVMFDFMLTDRPCLLYASDVEDYRKERDFFITVDSLPFPLAENNEEMALNIQNFNEEDYYKRVKEFSDYHGFCDDGTASKKVAEWIINKM